MGGEEEGLRGWSPEPTGSPLYLTKEDHWTHFDNSVNAVSFGFVATAILISMFLVMAIFEKFLRTNSPPAIPPPGDRRRIEAQSHITGFNAKLSYPSPKVAVKEVSVLMPGDNVPTFIAIAHPAPVPCPPERTPWPSHHHPKLVAELQPTTSTSG